MHRSPNTARHGNCRLGLVLTASVLFFTATVSAQNLYRTPTKACHSKHFETLACGGYGQLLMGTAGDLKSGGASCGAAELVAHELGGGGLYARSSGSATQEAWFPCQEGSCFSARPLGPWVAVVDWDDPHGWSVGETIRQASDFTVEPRLFPLGSSGLDSVDRLPAVGDVHVLAQLCHVAEASAHHPPLAVNMSFGRFEASDAVACTADYSSAESGLGCAIRGVLAHLRGLGVPVFAAAGHEGLLLYPAADPNVIAVGLVDVDHLAATGLSRPLATTPAGADALFPGHGLHLEEHRVEAGGSRYWAVPPGSSYASALAAGWWSAYRGSKPRVSGKILDLCLGTSTLTLAPQGAAVGLACGDMALPGSAAPASSALARTALGERPEVCGFKSPVSLTLDVERRIEEGARLTLAELQRDLSRPAPDSRPCVPCHGSGGGGDGSSEDEDDDMDDGDETTTTDLVIDLARSEGVAAGQELLGLYLRIGGETWRFSDSENAWILGELALGQVDALTLRGVPNAVYADGAALVFKLRLAGDPRVFSSSTPIVIHHHRKAPGLRAKDRP